MRDGFLHKGSRDDFAVIASYRFVLATKDVQSAFSLADREERVQGPLYLTMLKAYVKEGMHPRSTL